MRINKLFFFLTLFLSRLACFFFSLFLFTPHLPLNLFSRKQRWISLAKLCRACVYVYSYAGSVCEWELSKLSAQLKFFQSYTQSFLLPKTNTHTRIHTKYLFSTLEISRVSPDATPFLTDRQLTACLQLLSATWRHSVKKYLLRAGYYTRVSSFQYQLNPLITTTPSVIWVRKWSALSKHNVTAPQTFPMSWLNILLSPCGFERAPCFGLFPFSPRRPHAISNLEICNGLAQY